MNILAELKDYQDALRRISVDASPLAAQAEALVSLPDPEFEQALKAFNAAANDHSYYKAVTQERDYGALLLEVLAVGCTDARRQRQLYLEARERALIFASWATSGAEGIARMKYVRLISHKLDSLNSE